MKMQKPYFHRRGVLLFYHEEPKKIFPQVFVLLNTEFKIQSHLSYLISDTLTFEQFRSTGHNKCPFGLWPKVYRLLLFSKNVQLLSL